MALRPFNRAAQFGRSLFDHFPRLPTSNLSRGVLIGLVCGLLSWLAASTEFARSLDNKSYDAMLQLRGVRSSPTKVFIVTIDDEFLEQFRKPLVEISPELGKVVECLANEGVKAVGIDMIISELARSNPELGPDGAGDALAMGNAVNEVAKGRVVLSEFIGDEVVAPYLEWQPLNLTWSDVGFVNLTIDEDDMCLRKQRLRVQPPATGGDEKPGSPHPSFGLALLGKADRLDASWFSEPHLRLDDSRIPVDNDGAMYVNYVGPPGTIRRIPFSQVLKWAEKAGPPLAEDLRGAIVLIGGLNPGVMDMHPTPYTTRSYFVSLVPSSWLGAKPTLMQGIEIHANIFSTLADRAFFADLPGWLLLGLLLGCGAGLGELMFRSNLERGLIVAVVHHFSWKAVVLGLFAFSQIRAPVAGMLLLAPLCYAAVFSLRWRWLRRMMGMFKSDAVAKSLELDPRAMTLYGEERKITVLFSDMRNFTTFSEGRTPREVFTLLNAYFSVVVPIIEAHGGVVDKYMGDGIMVLFGAPFHQPDHAFQALCAGREMLRRVRDMQSHWESKGAANLRVGVGVHTGVAITGTLGSPTRLDYTAIGDTVNTASRLESATKAQGVQMLVSQATLDDIPASRLAGIKISAEPRQVSVKGKQQQLNVYTVDEDWPDARIASPDVARFEEEDESTTNTWEPFL